MTIEKNKPWTSYDEYILKTEYKLFSNRELAKKLNRTERAVATRLNRLGLSRGGNQGRVWTDRQLMLLKQQYRRMLNADLVKLLGVSNTAMHRKARELGLTKDENFFSINKRVIGERISKGERGIKNSGQFKKGEHRNQEKEYKKGHKRTEQEKEKAVQGIKAYWAKKKMLEKYGIKYKPKYAKKNESQHYSGRGSEKSLSDVKSEDGKLH